MRTRQPTTALLDQGVPVQAKLAAAWTSFVFLYVYVDILNFYKPGVVDGILDRRRLEVRHQPDAATVLTLLAIPIFMVVLSMALPARANRIVNLVVASLLSPVLDLQRGGIDWASPGRLLRHLHRNRGAPSRLHPPYRLDVATHAPSPRLRRRAICSAAFGSRRSELRPRERLPIGPVCSREP